MSPGSAGLVRTLFVWGVLGCLALLPASAQELLPPDLGAETELDLLAPVPTVERPDAAAPEPEAADPLDSLFRDLRREASPERASLIASRIQSAWATSGSATTDLLLGWAAQAAGNGSNGAAFDLFEQAIRLQPDHAESWNGRATLNFQLGEYARSLSDIEQTLQREPRHFGALVGLGAILEQLDRDEAALEAYRRALAVYPALRPAQDAVARLTAERTGQSL